MRADRLVAALIVALAMPRAAEAFCRTTTVPPPGDFDPAGSTCFTQGEPLYHPSTCVTYRIAPTTARGITPGTLSEILAAAFNVWTARNGSCTPGITVLEVAPTDSTVVAEYKTGQPNANVIGFLPGKWTHGETNNTLALTTLTFNAQTGVVLDADTELSSEVEWSNSTPPPKDGYDIGTAVVHEAGHFLGLAHTSDVDAIMFASYTPGTSRFELRADDERGICAIYPTRGTRRTKTAVVASTECQLTSGVGSSGTTCGEPVVVHGCGVSSASVAAPSRSGRIAGAACLGLAALAFAVARRRRRLHST